MIIGIFRFMTISINASGAAACIVAGDYANACIVAAVFFIFFGGL